MKEYQVALHLNKKGAEVHSISQAKHTFFISKK